MIAANLTPDYPRPAAPAQFALTKIAMTVLCPILAMILLTTPR